ncbi:hypothetical protein [Brevibacillus laterosporus]|uniref:hypothetical protein n=1 Tax=Brevibacillus laterosporus TaxID=1465 RepID=UPI00265D10F8|nr:hypothetical protein [Brevibacillus laterosporus]
MTYQTFNEATADIYIYIYIYIYVTNKMNRGTAERFDTLNPKNFSSQFVRRVGLCEKA